MFLQIRGTLKGTVTNPNNGESLDFNASGPATQTIAADGFFTGNFLGRTFLFAPT